MIKTIRVLLYLSILLLGFQSYAAVSPVSLALINPIEFPPDDFSITGARFSILFGHHRNVYGLDLGVVGNITDQDFTGLAVSGLFNLTHGQTKAIFAQLAGVANINTGKADVYGVQAALGLNKNDAASSVNGLQIALANISPFTTVSGFQVGVYNRALDVRGLQIGLVNVTDNLHGVQIGLINFNHKGTFVVSPILNAGF
jgi:hypothetical protein